MTGTIDIWWAQCNTIDGCPGAVDLGSAPEESGAFVHYHVEVAVRRLPDDEAGWERIRVDIPFASLWVVFRRPVNASALAVVETAAAIADVVATPREP